MLDDDCSPLVVLSTLYTLYMHNNSLCTEYTHRNKIPILVQSQYDTWDTSKLTVEDTHMRHPTGPSLIGVPGHLSVLIGQTRSSLISATAKATHPPGTKALVVIPYLYGTCIPWAHSRTLSFSLAAVCLSSSPSISLSQLSLSLSLSLFFFFFSSLSLFLPSINHLLLRFPIRPERPCCSHPRSFRKPLLL